MITEGQHLAADDLAGFMALAGDEQRVPLLQGLDRRADRGGAAEAGLWPRAPIKIVIFKMVDRLKLAKARPKNMWNRLNIAVSSLRSITPVTTQHRAIRYGSFRLRDRQL